MRRQDRCTDQVKCAQYEAEIDRHMANVEKYWEQLEGLEQKTQRSIGHVDALLGGQQSENKAEEDSEDE